MKVATLNLGDGPDATKAVALDRLVHHGASVIGLQEAGDRVALLQRWCDLTGWRGFDGNGEPGATSTPILWDPRVAHVSHEATRPATPATYTGRLGAGPSTVKPKVWNHIRVDGDETYVHINGHLPASLYLPRRRALAKKQVAVLADMVADRKRRGVNVVLTMDGNTFAADPIWRPLKRLGMTQHTKQATHGRRCIDLTWTLGLGGHTEVINVPSDHRAVVLTLKEK